MADVVTKALYCSSRDVQITTRWGGLRIYVTGGLRERGGGENSPISPPLDPRLHEDSYVGLNTLIQN